MEEVLIRSKYRHWKGGLYKVTDIALDSENPEVKIIIYVKFDGGYETGEKWARKQSEFLDIHPSGNKRFKLEL